jgi:hypothetical protein
MNVIQNSSGQISISNPKKYTLKDLKKGMFNGKNPKEKNLASKIDKILYQ